MILENLTFISVGSWWRRWVDSVMKFVWSWSHFHTLHGQVTNLWSFYLRTLLNYSKSTAYEELLKTANIKSLEHRRIEQALILVYKSIHNQTPNYIQEMFSLRSNGYSLRGHLKVVLPRPTSSYMQHSFTYQASKQWNNLTDKIRMSESLSIFRKNLQDIQLSSSYDCSCLFCKQIV